jgi:hypothetical protein
MEDPEAEPCLFEWLREVRAFRDFEARAARDAALQARRDDLFQFFLVQDDRLSAHATAEITACTETRRLTLWLGRAYAGEKSADIFPGPLSPFFL